MQSPGIKINWMPLHLPGTVQHLSHWELRHTQLKWRSILYRKLLVMPWHTNFKVFVIVSNTEPVKSYFVYTKLMKLGKVMITVQWEFIVSLNSKLEVMTLIMYNISSWKEVTITLVGMVTYMANFNKASDWKMKHQAILISDKATIMVILNYYIWPYQHQLRREWCYWRQY